MTEREFLMLLEQRASAAGIVIPQELGESLGVYFRQLALWNQKMNLAGFSLDVPTDAAIDRLFIEPLIVAQSVFGAVEKMVDIGSGGGSPALPMSLALLPQRTVLVEARARKAVFLKEVVRTLGLSDRIDVVSDRFESLAASVKFSGRFDLLTVRAVRLGADDLSAMSRLVQPGGRLILFRSGDETPEVQVADLRFVNLVSLKVSTKSSAAFLERV